LQARLREEVQKKPQQNSSSTMLPGRRRSCEYITYHCTRTIPYCTNSTRGQFWSFTNQNLHQITRKQAKMNAFPASFFFWRPPGTIWDWQVRSGPAPSTGGVYSRDDSSLQDYKALEIIEISYNRKSIGNDYKKHDNVTSTVLQPYLAGHCTCTRY
jgi:hypothetical protein